ncbi:DUF6587 family protein [Ideonella sp. BN130291]|uniref:DUF6587 family protein n=1 Tax=Ideonella sp. BN130291 TaxID=3112940 RepID=UPI002E26AB43|nr:DUF6587 family protein [Ideonella sp. BN130291]
MVQHLIVAFIVASAALYSVWSLLPAGARRKLMAGLVQRLGLRAEQAQRLEAVLATSGGCSDCSSCKGCATPVASVPVTAPSAERSRVIPIRTAG